MQNAVSKFNLLFFRNTHASVVNFYGKWKVRKLSSNRDNNVRSFREFVEKHRRKSVSKFKKMCELEQFDDIDKLFIAYIADERVFSFGERWMADAQVKHIKEREKSITLKISCNWITGNVWIPIRHMISLRSLRMIILPNWQMEQRSSVLNYQSYYDKKIIHL